MKESISDLEKTINLIETQKTVVSEQLPTSSFDSKEEQPVKENEFKMLSLEEDTTKAQLEMAKNDLHTIQLRVEQVK
jgi:hypothetical protein